VENKSVNITYCPTTEHYTTDLTGLREGVPKAVQLS